MLFNAQTTSHNSRLESKGMTGYKVESYWLTKTIKDANWRCWDVVELQFNEGDPRCVWNRLWAITNHDGKAAQWRELQKGSEVLHLLLISQLIWPSSVQLQMMPSIYAHDYQQLQLHQICWWHNGDLSDHEQWRAVLSEVGGWPSWCSNLALNISKTKEKVLDFRRQQAGNYNPLKIYGTTVERMLRFKCISVHISEDLFWSVHIHSTIRKARERLHYLRQLGSRSVLIF